MLSPVEITLIIILAAVAGWWWHIHGQRDYALKCIKAHCQKLNLTLLDGYVALKKITLKKDHNNKLRLARIYSFEFTVTGEQRYTGYITLFGYYVEHIELPPYSYIQDPSQDQDNVIHNDQPTTSIVTLDDYRKRKNHHVSDKS